MGPGATFGALERTHDYWSQASALAQQLVMVAESTAGAQLPPAGRETRLREVRELVEEKWRPLVFRREFEASGAGAQAIYEMDEAWCTFGECALRIDEAAFARAVVDVRFGYLKIRTQAVADIEEADAQVSLVYRNGVARAWSALMARVARHKGLVQRAPGPVRR